MKLSVSSLKVLEPRVEAVESQQRAQGVRLEHIDRVVMSIQADIQKLEKIFGKLEVQRIADANVLKEILSVQQQMLGLLQAKASI